MVGRALLLAVTLIVTLSSILATTRPSAPSEKGQMDSSCESDLCECGMAAKGGANRIIGGKDAYEGEVPWTVALTRRSSIFGPVQFCGGSIVSRMHVLTAAHCFDFIFIDLDIYRVVAGTLNWTEPNLRHPPVPISNVKIHPSYDFNSLENDFAILTVGKPFDFDDTVMPVCLPPNNFDSLKLFSGEDVVISGWGITNLTTFFFPDNLQIVTVQYVPRCECRTMLAEFGAANNISDLDELISDGHVCAGVPEGGKDTCSGDSGGPLTVERYGKTYQVGVTSLGYDCALPGAPGGYSDVIGQINWLRQNIFGECPRN